DLRPELDLLDVHRDLVLAGELGLLLLLVGGLPVVHPPRDGRVGLRGDLAQVEVLAPRVLPRLVGVLDADLRAVRVDQAHPWRADHLVDSRLRYRGAVGLHVSAWSQRRVTKLSFPPSLRQNRCKQRPENPRRIDSVEPPEALGLGGEGSDPAYQDHSVARYSRSSESDRVHCSPPRARTARASSDCLTPYRITTGIFSTSASRMRLPTVSFRSSTSTRYSPPFSANSCAAGRCASPIGMTRICTGASQNGNAPA